MSIIVQKFGGTSVTDNQGVLAAARWTGRALGVAVSLVIVANAGALPLAAGAAPSVEKNAPFERESVKFRDGRTVLAGTLYMPTSPEDHPAVVLLTGSNRGPRGPFLARIAKHYATQGIAALTYDSPGTGESTGNTLLQGYDDRAREAICAVRFLRRQERLNPDKVGVWGGSEGGVIALLAASKSGGEVAFAIAVSPSIASIFEQTQYGPERRGYAIGLTPEEIQKAITFKQLIYAFTIGADVVEWGLIESRVKRWPDEPWMDFVRAAKMRTRSLSNTEKRNAFRSLQQAVSTFSGEKWFQAYNSTVRGRIKWVANMDSDQFYAFLNATALARDWDFDPRDALGQVTCPVLGIWGADDLDVPSYLGATRLRRCLSESNHTDFLVKVFPKASHFLTTAGTGSEGEFVPGYLELITDWVRRRKARVVGGP